MASGGSVVVEGSFNYKDIEAGLARVEGKLDSFARENAQASASVSKGGQSVSAMAKQVQLLGAAVAGSQVLRFTGDLIQMGASSDRVERSLNAMTGSRADEFIESVGQASLHTISDMDAMSASAKALQFGVVENAEQMGRLTEAAIALGRITGRDATESINDFVTAAGRQSTLIADNLGLMIRQSDIAPEVNRLLAQNTNLTLSQAKAQAFGNLMLDEAADRLEETGGLQNDAAAELERFDAEIKNVKADAGEWLAHGLLPWIDGIRGVGEATKQQKAYAEGATSSFEEYAQVLADSGIIIQDVNRGIQHNSELAREQDARVKILYEEWQQLHIQQVQAASSALAASDALAHENRMLGLVEETSTRLPPTVEQVAAAYDNALQSLATYVEAQERQSSLQIDLLGQVGQFAEAQGGMADVFALSAGTLDEYGFSATRLEEMYTSLGLATGQITQEQITQSDAVRELTNLWTGGGISAQSYADSLLQIQQGADAAATAQGAIMNEVQPLFDGARSEIDFLTVALGNIGPQVADQIGQSARVAQQELEGMASGLPESLAEINAKITEATSMFEGLPDQVQTELVTNVDEVIGQMEEYIGVLEAAAAPRNTSIETTAPAAMGEVQSLQSSIDALKDKTVTININTQGTIPQYGGGGDFITSGPTLILVGDNPQGREHVRVTPLSGVGTTHGISGGLAMAGGGTVMAGGGAGPTIIVHYTAQFSGMNDMQAAARQLFDALQEEARYRGALVEAA